MSSRLWFPIMALVLALAMVFLYVLVRSTPVDPNAVRRAAPAGESP